ncbi:hypothetical protein CVD28_03295 [Bacillus sp. M6-12]|uniref:hypothetical protein n=1 Tax=Bacillus sp. M6-12 TaxID=2054166 RepID=UPI000C790465|nr:hypothetical protein [Bacillus sp. M6-12]PLS19455.1 hypothetical protein CVD28_03295 [Bacillus sp. M6-12]
MKIRLVSEGFGINELVEIDKWFAGDLMLKRKTPRRFEFINGWEKEDFQYKTKKRFEGYLKGSKTYQMAYLTIEEDTEKGESVQ